MRNRTKALLTGLVAVAATTACTPQEVTWWVDHPEAWHLLPCQGTEVRTHATDDPGQTTLDCDLTPPQTLTVLFDASSWGDSDSWGGDASVRWATEQALDMGCTPVWLPDHLEGTNCNY